MRLDLSAVAEPYRKLFRLQAYVFLQCPDLCGSPQFWTAVDAALETPPSAVELQLSDDATQVAEMKRAAERLRRLLDIDGLRRAAMGVYGVVSALDDHERALRDAALASEASLESGVPPETGERVDEQGE